MKNLTSGKEILITEQTFSIKKDPSFFIGSNEHVNAKEAGSAHISTRKLTLKMVVSDHRADLTHWAIAQLFDPVPKKPHRT